MDESVARDPLLGIRCARDSLLGTRRLEAVNSVFLTRARVRTRQDTAMLWWCIPSYTRYFNPMLLIANTRTRTRTHAHTYAYPLLFGRRYHRPWEAEGLMLQTAMGVNLGLVWHGRTLVRAVKNPP